MLFRSLSDPHLTASGALHATQLPSGRTIHVPGLPIAFGGEHLPKRFDPPPVGDGARAVLRAIGYGEAQIGALAVSGVISLPPA